MRHRPLPNSTRHGAPSRPLLGKIPDRSDHGRDDIAGAGTQDRKYGEAVVLLYGGTVLRHFGEQ